MNESDLRHILSLNIKRYRAYLKLSQAELAEKLDISIPFLSDIENARKWVSPRTLMKMAETFQIEAYELLRPEGTLPDDAVSVIEKYSAEIYEHFGETLEELRTRYISKMRKK
jgi:transcriptional regulator with XRE-family HTH domain